KMGGRAMCQAIRAIFITDLRFLVTDLRDFQVRPVRMQYAFAVSVPLRGDEPSGKSCETKWVFELDETSNSFPRRFVSAATFSRNYP
ncbi:MAG TPA: hypothetical protein VNY04_05690, partial [Chthoniobacterales bacterium]|nr:hypothetical protein [Chthoniobacterales bacterium]